MRSRQNFFVQFWLFLSKFGCHGNSLGSLKISHSTFKFADPEILTVGVNQSSIFYAELKSMHFCLFLLKFGCHGNSLCSLKNLDSIYEIADPENPTIHAKIVSICCTEIKSCLFECSMYLYHCGYRQFSIFFAKNSGNRFNILIKS